MSFLGDLVRGLFRLFRHPGEVRWDDVLFYVRSVGSGAVRLSE
jgi:hypothetical protein